MGEDIVIRVEGLSKKYQLGQRAGSAGGLRHAIEDAIAAPFRWVGKSFSGSQTASRHQPPQEFWALRNVTFDVRRGEVVGIIGRNGAGKSTLLKILSRITEPTEGRIGLKGRVASLLEVGTGFHPELSGRENVFLNGAVLGMKHAEVRRKFDEIVAFAGVEQFLDTPVKRYSSGMYVRLAFAVAAHLEPEILIVDEVLAVGDSEFQKKCLDKMREVTDGGRTVLFVSHNLSAVASLCNRAVYLKSGEIVMTGESGAVIAKYQNDVVRAADEPAPDPARRSGSGTHRINEIKCAGSGFA
ncbi:MAG: ABC transporter ATP-binding protein, partial [Verrucomicrobiaceae bacterium]